MLTDIRQDLGYACRLLVRHRAFSIAAILTLALGIGMTSAIFSAVDAVLLRPVPFPDPERLVMVWETDRDTGTTHEPAAFPDYIDFKQRSRTLGQVEVFLPTEWSLTPTGGEPTRMAAVLTSAGFLPMLGARPIAGRLFTADENVPGGPDVVVISERLWARLFNRHPSAVGSTIRVDDRPRTIIGVAPSDADFGLLQVLAAADYGRGFADRDARTRVDLWAPLQADAERLPRDTHPLLTVARLAPGASIASAQGELGAIAADLERTYPSNKARGVLLEPLTAVIFEPVEASMLLLLAAVALVLLISCVNVASLLLARGTSRRREVAVRAALGAATRRLVRQFIVENTVLTLVAAAAGVALAFAALRIFVAIAPADVPRLEEVAINARVIGVALLISALVGLAFGLVPVSQARGVDLQGALRGEAGASAGRERGRARAMLVVAEVALAAVLAIGAALLIKSFWQIRDVDPGFDPAGVLKAEFELPEGRYPADFSRWPDFQEMHRFNDALLARVSALPGVESAALAGNHPLDAGFTNSFAIVGREAESRDLPEISIRRVTPGYFRALRVPLVRGRLLSETDGTRAAPVALINETAARRLFGDRDPLGQQIAFWGAARTVVGVLGDEKFFGVIEAPPMALYVPLAQAPSANGAEALIVRTPGDPAALAPAIRRAIREIDPGLAVFGLEPLEDTLSNSVGERRFLMLLLALFAAVALVLAAIGIHGMLSMTVAQRTREIGIRIALGAPPRRVLGLVFRQGATLTAIGLLLGAALGAALARTLSGLLFGVTMHDVPVFASAAAVLGTVGLLATWLPARRAVRVDPLTALRQE